MKLSQWSTHVLRKETSVFHFKNFRHMAAIRVPVCRGDLRAKWVLGVGGGWEKVVEIRLYSTDRPTEELIHHGRGGSSWHHAARGVDWARERKFWREKSGNDSVAEVHLCWAVYF